MRRLTRTQLATIVDHYWLPLTAIVAVTILLVGYYGLINRQYQDFTIKADGELPALRAQVNSLNQQYQIFQQADREGVFSPQDEQLLSRVVPETFDFSSVVVQLTTIAQENKLSVTELSHSVAPTASPVASSSPDLIGVERTLITLKASGGSYDDFKAFVADLETSVLLFDVQEISFDPSKQNYELELMTYNYPKP